MLVDPSLIQQQTCLYSTLLWPFATNTSTVYSPFDPYLPNRCSLYSPFTITYQTGVLYTVLLPLPTKQVYIIHSFDYLLPPCLHITLFWPFATNTSTLYVIWPSPSKQVFFIQSFDPYLPQEVTRLRATHKHTPPVKSDVHTRSINQSY